MRIREIHDSKMPSITEWLQATSYKKINAFRSEDNHKRDRLEVLFQIINLPYDKPEKMMATDIKNRTKIFLDVLKRRGDEKCALRLVPTVDGLPKLRVRGKTLKKNLTWFHKQKIDHRLYKVEIIPHNDDTLYSAIFIVSQSSIQGEIVKGAHWQLTQGFHEYQPITFHYDYNRWRLSPNNDKQARKILKRAIGYIRVAKQDKQKKLASKLRAKFNNKKHLLGYFEFVVYPDTGITYIDYNRKMPRQDYFNIKQVSSAVKTDGMAASNGKAIGKIRKIFNPRKDKFKRGDILVCKMTTINFIPLMKKAGAIITEQGGILSHAAIVSRELKKPCLVMVKDATKRLKNGDLVLVNATQGTIHRLS